MRFGQELGKGNTLRKRLVNRLVLVMNMIEIQMVYIITNTYVFDI